MDIKIYKTSICGACIGLMNLLDKEGVEYKVYDIEKLDKNTLPELNGAPTVYVDGKMLKNSFAVVDMVKEHKAKST